MILQFFAVFAIFCYDFQPIKADNTGLIKFGCGPPIGEISGADPSL